jgi:two-component system, NarL family, nitrate/nitrite response regulator NarL
MNVLTEGWCEDSYELKKMLRIVPPLPHITMQRFCFFLTYRNLTCTPATVKFQRCHYCAPLAGFIASGELLLKSKSWTLRSSGKNRKSKMSTSLIPSLSEALSPASSSRIRVLIADETSMGCQLLKNALGRFRFRMEVVACATSCSEIAESVNSMPIDVALVSESLHGGTFEGFQALSELQASFPGVRVIMLLKSATRDLVVDAFRAGAKGVVCRTEHIRVLCKCIQTVHKGQIWANSHQLHFILEALKTSTPLRVINSKGSYVLAPREDEVASLVAEGMTNRQIAQKLGVAEHTVSNYLFRIYDKLGISSRVELVLYVLKQGLKQGRSA